MATAFDNDNSYIVKAPTSASEFETNWSEANECMVIHTHGSASGLFNEVGNTTPTIITKNQIKNLPINNRIHFIMMTACKTAGGTTNDNVAYWLSKKINPYGIVIANTDTVSGASKTFGGVKGNATWKVYRNGEIQNINLPVLLDMSSAYDIYSTFE